MAIYRKGADPVALRASARRLELCATTAGEVCDTAGRAVSSLRSQWSGGDLEHLTGSWPAAESQIRALRDTITRMSRTLERQAGQQDDTSAGTGGTPLAGRGSGGSGGPAPLPDDGAPPPDPTPGPKPYVPPGPFDQKHVDAAKDAVKDVLDGPGFWSMDGNRDDLETMKSRIDELTPAEAEALVRQLSLEDLAELGRIMKDEGGFLWVSDGLDPFDRSEVTSGLLSKVTPESAAKLQAAMPWSQPGFDTTDVALDGRQSQDGEHRSDLHYGLPQGELGTDDLSAQDVNQGSFSDCWAIASLTATTQADPDFVKHNITVNPNGTVDVRLFDHDGNPRVVTVTADLPLDADGNPVGAHGTNGETWPAYYEKAFAVVYGEDDGGAPDGRSGAPYDVKEQGTYGAVEWDYNDRAPSYITGNDPHGVDGFDGAVKAFNDKQGVIVSTPSDAPDNAPDGYVTRHVYYVQSVNADGTVTLGNPWGPDATKITVNHDEFDRLFHDPQAMQPRS